MAITLWYTYHSKASPTKDEPRLLENVTDMLLETVIDISKHVLLSSQSIASFLSSNLASSQPKRVFISPTLPHTLLSFSDNPPSCLLTPDCIQIHDSSATNPTRRCKASLFQPQPSLTGHSLLRVYHNKRRAQRPLRSGRTTHSQWLLVRISWIHVSRRVYKHHCRPACRHCTRWTQP